MATLTINGQRVKVDDSFLSLSPEQQNATVDEIASSLGGAQAAQAPVEAAPMREPTAKEMKPFTAMRSLRSPARAAMPGMATVQELGTTIDNGVRMAANGMTFGMADKFAGGMDAVTGQAPSYDAGVKMERGRTQAVRDANPVGAGVAEAAGGLATGMGLIKNGITVAGRVAGPRLFPKIVGYGFEGAGYGGVHAAGNTYSENPQDYVDNTVSGLRTGAVVGGIIPAAAGTAGVIYRGGSAFLGPRVEGLSRGASSMLRASAQADEAGLRNLSQMGPDAMLVDAGPSMLGLGQGAVTGNGPGKSMLVDNLRARDAGTGQRLTRAVDENLGPAPIPSQVEAGIAQQREVVGELYEPVFQNARAVNTQPLAEALEAAGNNLRGPSQVAVRGVRRMLDIPDAPGNLDPHPRALFSTRNAIDGMLADETNPQVIAQLTNARRAVDAELTRAVPGIKAVDAQYEELARQSGGLTRGGQVLDTGKTAIRPAELADETAANAQPKGIMVGPSAEPFRSRQGTRAEIDRAVGTNVNDLVALEKKLATPQDWNYQKLETTFGEDPVARVAQALAANRGFRQSYQDIVQNSQTAQRTGSARAMEGGQGGNVPHDATAVGLGLKGANWVLKAMAGASNANTKDEIARALASQGPGVQRIAQLLLDSAQSASANSASIKRLIARPEWIAASSPAASRK